ncbi:cylicin-2-like [Argopecten irradians]|uniref:cylicin-2-like n=1 Tax=Argopecten irradians TaxID=31199 RepID=UPI00372311B6
MESPEERPSPSIESHFIKKLSTVPACQAILGYYEAIKASNRIFEYGLTYVETGMCTFVGNITKNSWAGSTLDQYAGEGVERLVVKFPILEKAPKKLVTKTRRKTMKKMKKGAASVFDSRIGRLFTYGLKSAVNMSENLLVGLQPHGHKSPRKPDEKDGRKSEKTCQTEDGKKVTMVSSKEQQTELSGADMIKHKMEALADEGSASKLQMYFMEVLLFPLELMVEFLRKVHDSIPGAKKSAPSRKSARKGKPTEMSPEKKMEIESRRKVSPKKRIQSSLLGNLKRVTCRVLGLDDTSAKKQSDIRDFIKCSKHRGLNLDPVVDGDESEKKRKHDDMSDGSESTDEDLMYMDLDDYESEEDPDYEPTDSSMSDISIESDEGESEGELEAEKMGEEMYQLKEKDNKPEVSKTGQQPPKPDDKGHQNDKGQNNDKGQYNDKGQQKGQQNDKGQQNTQKGDLKENKNDTKSTKQDDKMSYKHDQKNQPSPKPDQRSQAFTKLDSKNNKSPSKDQKIATGAVEDKNKNVCKQPPKGNASNCSPIALPSK